MKKLILFFAVVLMFLVHSSAYSDMTSVDSIIYNEDKSITVYGSCAGEYEEFGVCMNFDEENSNFDNAVKYKAYGETNEEGKFGIIIPYTEFAHDRVFTLKTYAVDQNGFLLYSQNTLTADAESMYSRIPLLKSVIPSEGEIYPALTEEISEYYVLVDKLPEKPLSIKYEKAYSEDSELYTEASDIADTVKIKLSNGYNDNTYIFSYRLKKKIRLTPKQYFVKESGKIVSTSGGISSGSSLVNYIMLDTSALPLKFIPSKAVCNIKGTSGKNASVAVCTEPFFDTKNWSSVSASYLPQTGEYKKETLSSQVKSVIIDESELNTVSSMKFALKCDSGTTISDFSLDLEYFEDVLLPVTDASSDKPLAVSLSVSGANEIYPEFNPEIFEYYAVFEDIPEKTPKVSFTAMNPSSVVRVTPAVDINGETVAEISLNGKTNVYKVHFREYKEAVMKLKAAAAKRTPYELFTLKFPMTSTTPYNSYMGRIENEYGTSHSHLSTMAFDTAEVTNTNIHISTAELTMFATTNCSEGIYLDFYRSLNTTWVDGSDGRKFFATANHFVPRGSEGKLNGDTHIKYTGGKTNTGHFRYYTIPLKTVGFSDAKSINLYLLSRWQNVNPPNSTYQNAYIWFGINGNETIDGVGMIPTMYIKYFDK